MLFPTLDFALFFLIVYALAWTLNDHNGQRKLLLLAASYFFYSYWDWRFAFLLASSSLFNFYIGRRIDFAENDSSRKFFLRLGIAGNLSVLVFFKYYGFFLESTASLAKALSIKRDLPFLDVILPVGISFFTFQGMSYLIDLYRGKIERSASLFDILLYISFFPQLVAGPIVRAATFLPQLQQAPDPKRILAAMGFLLMLWGLFKKAIIANYLAVEIVDPVFFDPNAYGFLDVLGAVYAYAVQIYCDFSAYSDMAIGAAVLLGYHFPGNFDQPYRARSITEFWHRWHISLSTWLRDYLYIPLGGSRHGTLKTYRNLMVTMLLGGLWHGAAWNFILWGGLHGVLLCAERMIRSRPGRPDITPRRNIGFFRNVVSVLVVFHLVCLGWVFFRAASFEDAFTMLCAFWRLDMGGQLLTPFVVYMVVFGLGIHFVPRTTLQHLEAVFCRAPTILQGAAVGFVLVAVAAFSMDEVAPFIYFQF